YFVASPGRPTERYLYSASFDGKPAVRIKPAGIAGSHSYQISPGCKAAVHTFSAFDKPPVTEIVSLPDHKTLKVLAENKKLGEKLAMLKRPTSEFFRIDIGDGVKLDAWCLKPPDFDSSKKYPMLLYVYGEPAGQTVRDTWGGKRHLW